MPLDALVTGRIATFAGVGGFGWVEAVGIKDGRIAFAGSAVDLESRADPHTRRHELDPGEIAIPGITDAHLHLIGAALAAERLDLSGAATLDEGLRAIAAAAAARGPGDWLEGGGWDPGRWGRWPSADDLERVAPGRLIALWAFDHHALWVSHAALAVAAAASADHPTDPGGASSTTLPVGLLLESDTRTVAERVPRPTDAAVERAVSSLARALLAVGVVGVHDPGMLVRTEPLWSLDLLTRLAEQDELPIRVHVGVREDGLDGAIDRGLRTGARLISGEAPDRLRMGWLKLFADGTLSSGTAALSEPNAEGSRGLFTTPPEVLGSLAAHAASAGIATQIHAIGDAAVHAALDALAPTGSLVPAMPRVEHVQLCDVADRPRFAASGIAASVQPVHLREDAATARRAWGDRAERDGYAWRSLLDAGATLAFGTDAPVEPFDPWPGIAMSVLRRAPEWRDEIDTFGPGEALSLEQALRAATIGPAALAREPDRGRLVPGAAADLIVLPAAPGPSGSAERAEPEAATAPFANVRPRLVLVDGEPVIER